MDHPLRFIGGAVTVLAGLADRGLRNLEDKLPLPPVAIAIGGVVLVAVEHLTLAPNVWPLNTSNGAVPAIYDTLQTPGAIIDLPAARGDSIATNRYLYWQANHRQPIPYAHKVGPDLPNMNPALRKWTDLSRTAPRSPNDPGKPQPGADLERGLEDLYRDGFHWVVLHPGLMLDETQLDTHRRVLTHALGAPSEVDGDWVWAIPSAP